MTSLAKLKSKKRLAVRQVSSIYSVPKSAPYRVLREIWGRGGLLELEIRFVLSPIAQLEDERTAGVIPRTLRLPNISISIRGRIVGETAPTLTL